MEADLHILIVEDSPTQAALLEEALRLRGYRTQIAVNGSQALEAVSRQRPAAIVSDVRMPVMDGFQLCRAIKQNPGLHRIPVILLTALSTPADVLASMEAGADFHLPKPYQDDYLAAKITEVLLRCGEDEPGPPETDQPVTFGGTTYQISVTPEHMLRLLLSTYEVAIQQNQELLRAQDELQTLNEALKASNKELEAFSYSIGHDLRAPLRAINGYASILQEDYAAQLDSEGRRMSDIIASEGRRLGRLVDDLLAFSRLAREPLQCSPIDMEDMAGTVFAELAGREPGRTLQLSLEPLPPACGDPAMVRQVWVNLLANALKYTSTRDVAQIKIGSRTEGGKITYFVQDNGVGFDMKYADKLFGVFQRLHSEKEFEGTGVGLALIQRILRRHGGRVWPDAGIDAGATFFFTLPHAGNA